MKDENGDRSSAPFSSFSHFPSIPPPIKLKLTVLPDHPCPYLPGRTATNRGFWAESIPGDLYQHFMDAAFRRSGKVVYQPICRGCRECVPLRVPVMRFEQTKSQRRVWRRNDDLRVEIGPPAFSDEKFQLYQKYTTRWHGATKESSADDFKMFLYDSSVKTAEFVYFDSSDRMLGVGICDIGDNSLSSVYFYFDPDHASRSLGTYGALYELAFAKMQLLEHYYLGYWVAGCPTMRYKCGFHPFQLLGTDGTWRDADKNAGD